MSCSKPRFSKFDDNLLFPQSLFRTASVEFTYLFVQSCWRATCNEFDGNVFFSSLSPELLRPSEVLFKPVLWTTTIEFYVWVIHMLILAVNTLCVEPFITIVALHLKNQNIQQIMEMKQWLLNSEKSMFQVNNKFLYRVNGKKNIVL